jgi:hypothetical protein
VLHRGGSTPLPTFHKKIFCIRSLFLGINMFLYLFLQLIMGCIFKRHTH